MHIRPTIIFVLSFSLALVSPPFIFARMDFASRELRAVLGLLTIIVLISGSKKISLFDLGAFISVVSLFCVEYFWQRSQLENIFSYYAVIIVYVLLFRQLRNGCGDAKYFLNLWVQVACVLSILAILTFVFHQFTSINTDWLKFSSQANLTYTDYEYSIFGLAQYKKFGFVTLARVDGYFDEPQYAGMYFALNVLIAKELYEIGYNRYYFAVSVLAGLLTFSTTFYIALVVIIILYMKPRDLRIFIVASLFATFIFVIFYVVIADITISDIALIQKTSFSDRMARVANSVNILRDASSPYLMFGHGVGYTNNFGRGISSGFFHVLVERGISGFLFVLIMMGIYSNKNRTFFLICLFFLFALSWYKFYIYWFSAIVFWLSCNAVKMHMATKVLFNAELLESETRG